MNYVIHDKAKNAIVRFYHNVAKKYKHTYSEELMNKNIVSAYNSIYQIENGLTRRQPTTPRWKGMFMATAGKWSFAYKVENDTVYVYDACHSQNIHESSDKRIIRLTEEDLRRCVKETLKRVLNETFRLPHGLSKNDVFEKFAWKLSDLYLKGKITEDDHEELSHYFLYFWPNYANGYKEDKTKNKAKLVTEEYSFPTNLTPGDVMIGFGKILTKIDNSGILTHAEMNELVHLGLYFNPQYSCGYFDKKKKISPHRFQQDTCAEH